jgi:hypothetical protein
LLQKNCIRFYYEESLAGLLYLHDLFEEMPLGNRAISVGSPVDSCTYVSRIAIPAMPSDPYQSQVFRKLLRQTRHWFDRRQQTVRQLQVAASWSAQILIYPAYALFQSARSLGRTLGSVIQPDPSSPLPGENLAEIEISRQSDPLAITAETALQQILQVIEEFSLPECLPVGLEAQTTQVRAIACLVETQALVLVTQFNQILDVLNPHQQYELAQRIRWEVATYGRFMKRSRSVFEGESLRESRRSKSLPKRVIGVLQGARSWLFNRLHPTATHALSASSDSLSVDVPVQQSMLAVRAYLAEIDVSSHLPSLRVAPNLSAPSSIFIRGVATQLDTRSLVLVTNHNQILDILDADQQTILQQRIIWEVAHYCRYLRLRQSAAQLDVVRSPGANSPVFPGVRPFYQLMAWMQQGSVAIATNLFKEADLADSSAIRLLLPQLNFAQLRSGRDSPSKTLRERFKHRVTARLTAAIHRPERSLNAELISSERKTSERETSPITLSKATQMISEKPDQSIVKKERSPTITPNSEIHIPEIIDTEVTLLGYEQSLLERIMHLLDLCFLWSEEFIRLLWNGLLKLLPKR